MEQNVMAIKDYLEILLRRKWNVIVSVVIAFAVSVAVAYKLPPTYSSTAKLLAENPEISENYLSDPDLREQIL